MKFIPQGVTRTVGRQLLTLKKNSPHLAFGVGVAGVLTGTVLACKATLKLEDTLDEMKDEVDGVKKHHLPGERGKDLAYVYAKGTGKLVRLYAPSAVVMGASIGALTGSHVVLTKRNNALTATVVALTKAYDEYRERVREELGEERELDIYHGAVIQAIEDEDGKTRKIKVADPNKISPYARFFDEYSPQWQKNPEMNRIFVQVQQNYANQLLQARGHVFLNEVYDMLGIPRSQQGAVVGWVIGDEGDNYIDFGIFDVQKSDFVNGWNRSVLLDFNVDGVIFDKI